MERFLTGVNYWPRRSAMYMWERFDLGEIREDAARIHALGLDVVRFFLSWEAFQPTPDLMDEESLEHLGEMMDAFADIGLRAMPTLFCGHMSGVNWLPAWTLDEGTPHGRFRTIAGGRESPCGIGDFYADETLLASQELFCRTVGKLLRGHPALYLWDLGNEFSNLREPTTPDDAADWSARLTHALLESSDVGATGGIHGEDLERYRGILPSSIAAPWEHASMHGYSVYSAFSRGRLDAEVVPYLSKLAQSCSQKRVLFTEFGNPTCPPGTVSPYDRVPLPGDPPNASEPAPDAGARGKRAAVKSAPYACLSEHEITVYASAVLDRLQRDGALGAFWWCWADYVAELAKLPPFDNAPHELTFGIIRNDGTAKPIAGALKAFAAQRREVAELPPSLVDESAHYRTPLESIATSYAEHCRR
jgi:endo-1,4-beta-mannosidase